MAACACPSALLQHRRLSAPPSAGQCAALLRPALRCTRQQRCGAATDRSPWSQFSSIDEDGEVIASTTSEPWVVAKRGMFDDSHIQEWSPQLLAYLPFGVPLALLRMFLWAAGVLLDAPWFRSPSVVAAYLQLLGFKATWRNQHLIPKSYHVMVSNHTTSADLMMLFQLPKRYIHLITTAMPAKVTATRHLPVSLRPASAPVYTLLAQQAGEAGAAPVHVFPEGGLTNGSSMLQFSRGFTKFVKPGETWVVPVALRARTPFGIRTHTLTSSFLANLFFISLCPWLEVEAVVLPPTQQAAEEGRGAFVQRVQRAIATELGVPVSQMTIKQKHTLMKAQRQRPEGV